MSDSQKNNTGFKWAAVHNKHASQMIFERKGIKSCQMEEVAKFQISLDLKVANNGSDITYVQMKSEISHHN